MDIVFLLKWAWMKLLEKFRLSEPPSFAPQCWRLASGQGSNALHLAAAESKTGVLELLLEANAPVDVGNKNGQGPQFGHDLSGPPWLLEIL